mmetsp:Transcript_14939/g.32532  ORF Transcript_14939/g.32532 Transcript_14939/m.32532 type:complete len:249 (+) Transcript_14939:343-1089(+)
MLPSGEVWEMKAAFPLGIVIIRETVVRSALLLRAAGLRRLPVGGTSSCREVREMNTVPPLALAVLLTAIVGFWGNINAPQLLRQIIAVAVGLSFREIFGSRFGHEIFLLHIHRLLVGRRGRERCSGSTVCSVGRFLSGIARSSSGKRRECRRVCSSCGCSLKDRKWWRRKTDRLRCEGMLATRIGGSKGGIIRRLSGRSLRQPGRLHGLTRVQFRMRHRCRSNGHHGGSSRTQRRLRRTRDRLCHWPG